MAGAANHGIETITAILLAVVGVAAIAVLVSRGGSLSTGSTTGTTLISAGSAFTRILCTALAPIGGCGGQGTSVNSTITFGGIG